MRSFIRSAVCNAASRVAGAGEAASDVIERVLAPFAAFEFLRLAQRARERLHRARAISADRLQAPELREGHCAPLRLALMRFDGGDRRCEHLLRRIASPRPRAPLRDAPASRPDADRHRFSGASRPRRSTSPLSARASATASVDLRAVCATHSADHRLGPVVATGAHFGDSDVAGRECLIERIVDVAQHVARVCQFTARRRNRDERRRISLFASRSRINAAVC